MNSKISNAFNHLGLTEEEKIFAAHCVDDANLALNSHKTIYTNFLDIREQKIAESAAGFVKIDRKLFGGFNNAFRVMCAFGEEENFPIDCIKISFREEFPIAHRDILGTIMSLNIDRNVVGDILVDTSCAYIFIKNQFTDMVINEVSKIKNVGVKCEKVINPVLPKIQTKEVSIIVSSPRLDSIVSELSKMSREKSANLIRGQKIFVDGKAMDNPSYNVKEEQYISIRGVGKFKYLGANGKTRSNRDKITLEMFI